MPDNILPFDDSEISPGLQRILKIVDGIFREDVSDELKSKKFDRLMSLMMDQLSDQQLDAIKRSRDLLKLAPDDYRETFLNLLDGKVALRQIMRADESPAADGPRTDMAANHTERFPTCKAVGHCPRPTHESAPYHHFYWDSDRDEERMDAIHNGGDGHDDPESDYGSVECKTCGLEALVLMDSEDFPEV